jgi:F-type H+-transporting ATPase subunit b
VELNATIFLQAAIFFVLLGWLTPTLFDPFLKLFEERERRIVGAAHEAKRLSGSADERALLIEQKTKDAQAEARKVLSELRAKAAEREAEIVAAARSKAGERLEEARADLFETTEEARRALKEQAKGLSGDIAHKILGRAA